MSTYHSLRHCKWINFIEPAHLQGVINGFPSSSVSSKHILQAFPLSKAAAPFMSFPKPPALTSPGLFIPLKYIDVIRNVTLNYLVNDISGGSPLFLLLFALLSALKLISSWKVVTLALLVNCEMLLVWLLYSLPGGCNKLRLLTSFKLL